MLPPGLADHPVVSVVLFRRQEVVHSANYRRLVPGVSVIKGFKVCMNLPSSAEILYSLFVLERVRVIEVFLEEMYENFVGT